MVNIPRIHCHSAFKHYEMFHSCSDSSYGNSIFNTTYNFNGGTMCGGGFWGGLLGGLGMGLGAGIMNFLGGGSMFGGGLFGGGMFGGGMGMFGNFGMFGGGFSPFASIWNNNSTPRTDGAGGRKENPSADDSECKDIDDEKIDNLTTKYNELKNKSTITQEEIDALKQEIEDAKENSDDIHKDGNDASYKNLLELVGKLEPKSAPPVVEDDGDKISIVPEPPKENNGVKKDVVPPSKVTPVEEPKQEPEPIRIALHFAKHDKAGIIDSTIKGIYKGIKTDKGSLKYYVIDCNDGSDNSENTFKLRYKVTYKDKDASGRDIYNVRCISKKHNNTNYHLYRKEDGVDYVYDEETGTLVNETDDTVVSTRKRDGYDEITRTTEELTESDYEQFEFDNDAEIEENEVIIKA